MFEATAVVSGKALNGAAIRAAMRLTQCLCVQGFLGSGAYDMDWVVKQLERGRLAGQVAVCLRHENNSEFCPVFHEKQTE